MTKTKPIKQYYLLTAILLFLLIALSRGISIWYSFAATDILYIETALPTVLFYARQILSIIAFGAGIAATVTATFRFGEKGGIVSFFLHGGVLLLDAAAAFLIDVLSGAVSGVEMVYVALCYTAAGWIWNVVFAFLIWWAARWCLRRSRSAGRAVRLATVFYMVGRLLLETVYLLQFLVSVEFAPYAQEIVTIVGEYLGIILFYGGVTWLTAYLLSGFFLRRFSEKT